MFPFVRPLNIHPPGATGATGGNAECEYETCVLEFGGTGWTEIGTSNCPQSCFCDPNPPGLPQNPQQYDTFTSSCIPFGN